MRTFIAIELPPLLQHTVRQQQQQLDVLLTQAGQRRAIHWTQPDKVHLTLRFLGETTEQQRQTIQQKLTEITSQQKPFALGITEIGCFPTFNRPNIIWLGLHHSEPLLQLQRQIERVAQAADFTAEPKSFQPHLTIGRMSRSLPSFQAKKIGQHLAQQLALLGRSIHPAEIFVVDHLVHMQSQLQPTGAIYKPLPIFNFMGADIGDGLI